MEGPKYRGLLAGTLLSLVRLHGGGTYECDYYGLLGWSEGAGSECEYCGLWLRVAESIMGCRAGPWLPATIMGWLAERSMGGGGGGEGDYYGIHIRGHDYYGMLWGYCGTW